VVSRPTSTLPLLLASLAVIGLTCRAPSTPPNVVIVVLDTVRADRCSVNGYERPTTPELAKVAAEGVTFLDAWSPAGWTGPAHASLFTGLRTDRHGFLEGNRIYLAEEIETLAEQLNAAGYATGCFTNNRFVSAEYGLTQGFETVVPVWEREDELGDHRAPITVDEASRWALEIHRTGRPFFLFVNLMEAHTPYAPPAEHELRFAATHPRDRLDRGRSLGGWKAVAFNLGAMTLPSYAFAVLSDLYDAEVATADASLPGLLEPLRQAGILDDTLVVITSDHGENLGEHGLLDHKFSLHRTILHVPLVVRYPDRFEAGRTVAATVRLEDVMPTILEATGQAPVEPLDGSSLAAATESRRSFAAFGNTERYAPMVRQHYPDADLTKLGTSLRSVYDGRYHYIRYSDGREELYDVKADPAEERDLVASDSELLARSRALLDDAGR